MNLLKLIAINQSGEDHFHVEKQHGLSGIGYPNACMHIIVNSFQINFDYIY